MPIPKPRNNESKNDFVSRCVSDEKMMEEFPDQKQRVAVCLDSWTSKKSMIDNVAYELKELDSILLARLFGIN